MTLDVQDAPSSAGEDTLSMIKDLRSAEAPAAEPEGPPTTIETKEVGETNETTDPTPEDLERQAEERRNALLREIAIDPDLTGQYVQQQYQPAPPQTAAAPPQKEQGVSLPFDEFSFDAGNPAHIQALFDARLNEVGGPMFEKLDFITQQFQQAQQAQQYQQIQQLEQEANNKTVAFLDTYVPGFSGIVEKVSKGERLTATERAVLNEAVNAESAYFQAYQRQGHQHVVYDVQARAKIAQQIGPALKEYAKELGLVAQPSAKTPLTPEQQKQMKQEMYVESSNAVPAANAGNFDKAHQSGDTLQMIRALRGK